MTMARKLLMTMMKQWRQQQQYIWSMTSGHIRWNFNLLADESDKNSNIGKKTESNNCPVHEDETVLGQRSYPECIGIDVFKNNVQNMNLWMWFAILWNGILEERAHPVFIGVIYCQTLCIIFFCKSYKAKQQWLGRHLISWGYIQYKLESPSDPHVPEDIHE